MDYIYSTILYYLNYFLDTSLYYKIVFQESFYFKSIYEYIYPPNNIVHAKIYTKEKCIDITSHFINLSNNELINWKDLLIKDAESLEKDEHFHVDIKYTIENNHYRVIYKYGDNISFPPYKKEEIEMYNKQNKYKNKVLFAEIDDKDITKLIKEYSGPLDDFYHNRTDIHACLIKDDSGKYILVEDDRIKITDAHVNELEFSKEDILKL